MTDTLALVTQTRLAAGVYVITESWPNAGRYLCDVYCVHPHWGWVVSVPSESRLVDGPRRSVWPTLHDAVLEVRQALTAAREAA